MRTVRVCLCAAVLLLTAFYTGHHLYSADAALRDDPVPPKFALLVGINDYKNGSGIRNLTGAHNDVRLMRSLLDDLGFRDDAVPGASAALFPCGAQKTSSGIRTLCSVQATKAAILSGFDDQLIKNAKNYWKGSSPVPAKGPTVVFYYSGHGSQLPDNEPIEGEKASDLLIDEADGLDETLVPYDSDLKGTRDIRDDSLKTRIDELKTYTTNIVFMADSCHSGTISRGPGARNIAREFGDVRPNPAAIDASEMPADNAYVTISGSLPTQLSFEDDVPDPTTQKPLRDGLLTYYFVQAVRQDPGATYREIISLVRNTLSAAGKNQTPQVEGDIDRVVFGAAGAVGKKAIGIRCSGSVCTSAKNDGRGAVTLRTVTLDAGEVVGATAGAPVVIYAPGTADLAGPNGRIALGTITAAGPFSSEAEVEFLDAKLKDLPPLSRVVLVSPGFSSMKRRVAIDLKGASPTDPGAERMKTLVGQLRERSAFYTPVETTDVLKSITGGQAGWDLAVARGTYADLQAGIQKRERSRGIAADEDGYFIVDRSGIPLYDLWVPAGDGDAAGKLMDALEKHAKVVNIRALNNQVSGLADKIRVEQVRYRSAARQGTTCTSTPYSPAEARAMVAGDAPMIRRSEAFDIRITNNTDRRLYFYVYSIDAAGAISLLFPVQGANEQIAARSSYLTSQGNPCWLLTFSPDSPTGFETVKVLVSERPVQADLLISPGIRAAGADSFLDRLLRQAGSNTRSERLGGDNTIDDWAAFDLDYTVVP